MLATDRFKRWLEGIVSKFVSKYDYACPWGCTVVSQNADGTLELKPDRPDMVPGLSNVPILYAHPGVKATVQQGARCLVFFVNADPSLPCVFGFETHDLVTLNFADGTAPIARVGDLVQITFPAVMAFAGTISGAPAVGTVASATPAVGIIATGQPKVQA